jgi:dCMP deaminase
MSKGTDLSQLYNLRSDFTIIGLTGRNASGYQEVGVQLSKGFVNDDYPHPQDFDLSSNSFKKYRIIHKYASINFPKYTLIKYRDVITLFLTKYPFENFKRFLQSEELRLFFTKSKILLSPDFQNELNEILALEEDFTKVYETFRSINYEDGTKQVEWVQDLNSLYCGEILKRLSNRLHSALQVESFVKHNLLMEILTNNIRQSGNPFETKETDANKIFSIVILINAIIKAIRKVNEKNPTKIVIDSFRNPLEIMYFKQRFSAFYIIAVNRDNTSREAALRKIYGKEFDNVHKVLEAEYTGGKGKGFYRQYVRDCIEKADIHITFRSCEETKSLNQKLIKNNESANDATSPYFSWQMQLLKYVALIEHPGLITPSPEERCMQLAYTAKYNSGCISRQVGAAICDEHYSIKAIGWNSTPEGQVPCLLRNAEVLLNSNESSQDQNNGAISDLEIQSFTPYERKNKTFRNALKEHYASAVEDNRSLLKGRNVCICFKTLQNSCSEGKNQVHTRALHAEESAFLQITKYGGTAIRNGKLFTTASPCELCAKKAYQLGIKVIYYVDPYPGISIEQILTAGSHPPELRLFNGAIGNAYHWLYEPLMAYKDELSLLLGLNIKDKLSQLEEENHLKDKEIEKLKSEIKNIIKNNPQN